MKKKIKFLTKNLLIFIILFVLVRTAFIYLQITLNNLPHPYSILAGLEDENLARSLMVLNGKSLYSPLTDYPFVVTLYPPVYFYLAALFIKFFGVTFFAGRLLSFICSLLVCFLCFRITWLLTKNIFWGLVAGMLFMVSGFVQWWGLMFKNDIMAVCFALAGIALFLEFEKSKKYLLSIPFLILAVFTKQTAITAALAIMVYLLFAKRKKDFFHFSFWFLGISSLLFLFLTIFTQGNFFIDTILVPRSINWNFLIFENFWLGAFYSYGYLLFPAIGFIILERILYQKTTPLSWFFIFSVLARYDIGIVGSSENYFMETIALSGILTVLFLKKVFSGSSLPVRLKKKSGWLSYSVPLLLVLIIWVLSRQTPPLSMSSYGMLVLFLIFFFLARAIINKISKKSITSKINLSGVLGIFFALMFMFFIWQKFIGMTFPFFSIPPYPFPVSPPSLLTPYQEEISRLIKDNPGRILIDSESYLAIKNNRDFEYLPIALKLRQQAGYWDFKDSKFFDDIGKQKFRFYIKSQGWSSQEIMAKINEHYKLTKIVDVGALFYEIFEPTEEEYVDEVVKMRQHLDKIELNEPELTQIFVKKIGREKYLVGYAFAPNLYGEAFMRIVKHPQFVALYRPLHFRHPNSSVIFQASNFVEVEAIIADIFAGPEYTIVEK